jgi:hypothetical protein
MTQQCEFLRNPLVRRLAALGCGNSGRYNGGVHSQVNRENCRGDGVGPIRAAMALARQPLAQMDRGKLGDMPAGPTSDRYSCPTRRSTIRAM